MTIIIPIVLIVGGVLAMVFLRSQMANKVREMKFMETTTVKDLLDMFSTMQSDGLGDHFRHYVEVKGTVYSPETVRTPFSDREVAYCASKLAAVTQREERYRDNDGNMRTRIQKSEETITMEDSSNTLLFKDSSSDQCVVLDIKNGCSFDVPETFDRFENVGNLNRYSYFRNFHHNRANLLGYRMQEKTVSLNQPLYVLGEAYKEGDIIHIGKPTDRDKTFIVSTKSEDEMSGKCESNAKFAFFGGIAAIVVGVGLLIYQLIA